MAEWCHAQGCNPHDTVGLGLWGDSAPCTETDSPILILWNVITRVHHERYFFGALAKRAQRACGCGGRCTYESFWRLFRWALAVFESGRYPAARDDGVPFSESKLVGDQERAKWAKEKRRLCARGGCVQKRGDWPHYKLALGLTGWAGYQWEGVLEMQCLLQFRRYAVH